MLFIPTRPVSTSAAGARRRRRGDRDAESVRTFGVFTVDLRHPSAAWLKKCLYHHRRPRIDRRLLDVVMRFLGSARASRSWSSTPRMARNLKKEDRRQRCGLAPKSFTPFGMLKSCFRPDKEVRALRTLWRHLPSRHRGCQAIADDAEGAGADERFICTWRSLISPVLRGSHPAGHRPRTARSAQTLAAMRDPNCKKEPSGDRPKHLKGPGIRLTYSN